MIITRKEAEALLGKNVFRAAVAQVPSNHKGAFYLLHTGAKLCINTRKTGKGRYYIYGYSYDGSDVYSLMSKVRPGFAHPVTSKVVAS